MVEKWKPFPTKLPKSGKELREQEDQREDPRGGKKAVRPKVKIVQKKK